VKIITIFPEGTESSIKSDVYVDTMSDLQREWGANSVGWMALLRPDTTFMRARA